MALVKCHLNAVVSEDARFGALEIADYHLGADMPEEDVQSLKTCLGDYPPSLLDELGLADFLQQDRTGKAFVHANIVKTVLGLKNSGLLSQNRLVRHLASCGCHHTATPTLFRHHSRGISFTLVVDDFGAKHTSIDDFHHLQTPLELLCLVASSPTGARCLGFDVDFDRPNRIMPLSRGGCIPKLLKSVVPESVKLKLPLPK
jgi:hypothetical protein